MGGSVQKGRLTRNGQDVEGESKVVRTYKLSCKNGNLDMVKLLAGTYQANVNVRSRDGYTPLHIAALHNLQEVFDLLVQVRPDEGSH